MQTDERSSGSSHKATLTYRTTHCERCGLKNQGQIITNAFRYSFSNGVTEGLNNKMKVIKRVVYGYRNFYHFRSRIYSIQGLIFSQHEKEKQANSSAAL
ncbi:transposase [Enterococcus sp. LJL51]|uniref:transposase n=1 Tax=Enterococcus sp. LJL51 TaxID=3416656 RepID=UPI003CEE0E76